MRRAIALREPSGVLFDRLWRSQKPPTTPAATESQSVASEPRSGATCVSDQQEDDVAVPTNKNPRKHVNWRHHRSHFSALVKPSTTRGLEIGAFDLPLIEPEEGHCDFADYNDQPWLLDAAERMAGHSPEFVVPVTYSVRDGYESLPRNYDWIAASHIIEHIPDVLGWLVTLADHLKPDGILFLTIPDKRYIFDIHRHETTFSQVAARHRIGLTRPSFEQVFDSLYYSIPVLAHDVWVGSPIDPPRRDYEAAHLNAERAEHEYIDAHCSVFTPDSFLELASDLISCGLIPYRLERIKEPPPGGCDFSASLVRISS